MTECFTTDARSSGVHAFERRAGALAAAAWLRDRRLRAPAGGAWDVTIALEVCGRPAQPSTTNLGDSRFELAITASAWAFLFRHRGLGSGIRVTDVAAVNERDDYELLRRVPPLRDMGSLIRTFERRHAITFRREHACVRTSLVDAEPQIRAWIAEAL